MIQNVVTTIHGRNVPRQRDLVMPAYEPRCFGRGCEQRATCERYTRAVYESKTRNAKKGYSTLMSLADDDGVCRSFWLAPA